MRKKNRAGSCRGYETVLYRWTRAGHTTKGQECVRSHRVSVAVSHSFVPRRDRRWCESERRRSERASEGERESGQRAWNGVERASVWWWW